VVCLQIVDLLPEHQHPQVLAEKLNHVQCIGEARAVAGEAAFSQLYPSSK
jgi:hypothetical protein